MTDVVPKYSSSHKDVNTGNHVYIFEQGESEICVQISKTNMIVSAIVFPGQTQFNFIAGLMASAPADALRIEQLCAVNRALETLLDNAALKFNDLEDRYQQLLDSKEGV